MAVAPSLPSMSTAPVPLILFPRSPPPTPRAARCGGAGASACQSGQGVLTPDELVGLGTDHVARRFQLAVEQQAPDLTRPAEERRQRGTREALRHVATRTRERTPDRSDRRLAGPDEQRPAPVPAPAEVLRSVSPRRRPPEQRELAGRGERLPGVGEAAERDDRHRLKAGPSSRGEIDRDDLAPRRLQLGAEASSE